MLIYLAVRMEQSSRSCKGGFKKTRTSPVVLLNFLYVITRREKLRLCVPEVVFVWTSFINSLKKKEIIGQTLENMS